MPSIIEDETFTLVRNDMLDVIGNIFTADSDDAFTVRDELRDGEVIRNEDIVVVPWVYECVHTAPFQGLFATGRSLTIEGVTVIDTRPAEPMLQRFVDWLGVIAQLGIDVSWRLPVTEEEYGRDQGADS